MDQKIKPRVLIAFKFDEDLLANFRNNHTNVDLTTIEVLYPARHEYIEKLKGYNVVVIHPYLKIDKEFLDSADDSLELICTYSVGYEHIDLNECKRRNVKVVFAPYPDSSTMSEFTIGLLLNVSRRISEAAANIKNKNWIVDRDNLYWFSGVGLKQSTVGIFGLGSIGMGVAKRLSCFELNKIIYCNRNRRQEADELGYEFVSFEELVKTSDFLIVSCSANKDNEKIFNKNAFNKMKKNLILINISRGSVVDHDDLYDALTSNTILGAGLDVFDPFPLPKDHKLYSLPNCCITPHLAWAESRTTKYRLNLIINDIINYLEKKPLANEIKIE